MMAQIEWLTATICFSVSFVLALLLTPIMRKLAFAWGALDRVEKCGRERARAMPRLGGMAIFLAVILPVVFMAAYRTGWQGKRQLVAVVIGSTLVWLIGIYDDMRGAPVWSRLGVEIGAAVFVYLEGVRIVALAGPADRAIHLGWLSLPATVIWIVIITNAVNLIDGLDGLAAGTGILILLSIVLLNWERIDPVLILCSLMLLGALLGFLAFNFPPASVVMGDSGSLFLGFFLSSFAVLVSTQAPGGRTVWLTLLAFSLPLLDMAYAVLRRWHRGVPVYRADQDHLHHKLLQKGLAARTVTLLFYAANLLMMLVLILMLAFRQRRLLIFFLPVIMSLSLFIAFQLLHRLKPHDFLKKMLARLRALGRNR
jgi:UDP-GlcNAc:undecaprenyl-phosphate GlcNAc-1-phosphate transferase